MTVVWNGRGSGHGLSGYEDPVARTGYYSCTCEKGVKKNGEYQGHGRPVRFDITEDWSLYSAIIVTTYTSYSDYTLYLTNINASSCTQRRYYMADPVSVSAELLENSTSQFKDTTSTIYLRSSINGVGTYYLWGMPEMASHKRNLMLVFTILR